MRKLALFILLTVALAATAQREWPRTLGTKKGGKIIVYQPQPESINDGKLIGRAAVSVREIAGDEPIFGAIWCMKHNC